MPRRSTGLPKWLLLLGLLSYSSCQSAPSSSFENKTDENDAARPRTFLPRMDYDEWTPLGRGDPLKNNPTFDYVPPVSDRVQYWLSSHTTEPSSKRDILVLGVTAKKTSPKIPEQFLKFVEGPKFARPAQVDTSYRSDFTGSSGAEPPKIMRTTNFRNGLIDYRNQNRLQSLPTSYYPNPYYGQKMKPYTMMMPPPMIQRAETSTGYNVGPSKDRVIGYVSDASQSYSTQTEEGPVFQDVHYYGVPSKDYYSSAASLRPYSTVKAPSNKGIAVSQVETIKSIYTPSASRGSTRPRYETTTAPSVSFEKSNLIYLSTQTLSGGWLNNNGPTSSSSTALPDIGQVAWQTSNYSRDQYDHHAAASSNHDFIVGQNANVIVDDGSSEEAFAGQKDNSTEATSSTSRSVPQTSTVSTTTADSNEEEEEEQENNEEQEEAVTDAQPSQKMHIVIANSPASVTSSHESETHEAKRGPVAVVMPTNYVDRNSSSSTPDPLTTLQNVWENPTTSEMTRKTTHQTAKPEPQQPTRTAVTSSPILMEDRPPVTSLPNRMMLPSQSPHQSALHPPSASVMPSRHVNGLSHTFVPPQGTSQSMTRPQTRPNNAVMHSIGGARPSFRPSSLMSHVRAPLMPYMSMSPEKIVTRRPPQSFPVTFTSPSSSTVDAQTGETSDEQRPSIDHRPSPLSATIMNSIVTTSAPLTLTLSSTAEYTTAADTYYQPSARPDQSPLMKILSAEETAKTTLAPPSTTPARTTTVPSLTTDPIFSHYKQPAKPIRGPMYLIIQGHSKVKTYKPTMNKHGVPVENNEIVESVTERQLSKLEQLIRENAKNVAAAADAAAEKRKLQEKARAEKLASSRQDTLVSLVESGLSGFTVSPSSTAVTEDEPRRANAVTSVEIN